MMQVVKILHLSTEPYWRGGEQQIIYLTEESLKLGLMPIIGCKRDSPVEHYCRNKGLSFVSLPFKSAYDIFSVIKVIWFCKRMKIDILQTHSSKSHTIAVFAGILGLRIPQILTRRVNYPVKSNWFSHYKYNYFRIKKIICISETIQQLIENDIKDKRKLITIHSGVGIERFQKFIESDWLRTNYNLSKDTIIIGNSSALTEHKDYETWLNVANKILSMGIQAHFFIMGDGPQRRDVEGMIYEKGLEDHVSLLGFVDNIQEVLPSLDVFLFTSQMEGLGTSILDAMASRVPVVSTAAGGVSELIKHERTGMLYPIGDVEGLTTGLHRIINDQELRERLINAGSETVKQFSKEITAVKTKAVYEEILNKKAIR